MSRLLMLTLLLAPACPVRSEVERLTTTGGPAILVGHYPGYVQILYGPDHHTGVIRRLRADVESHEGVLRHIVREHIELKSPLEFEFKYAAADTAGRWLMLRYFARHPNPTAIAGWEVQLLYRLPGASLDRAYVGEVPLE